MSDCHTTCVLVLRKDCNPEKKRPSLVVVFHGNTMTWSGRHKRYLFRLFRDSLTRSYGEHNTAVVITLTFFSSTSSVLSVSLSLSVSINYGPPTLEVFDSDSDTDGKLPSNDDRKKMNDSKTPVHIFMLICYNLYHDDWQLITFTILLSMVDCSEENVPLPLQIVLVTESTHHKSLHEVNIRWFIWP